MQIRTRSSKFFFALIFLTALISRTSSLVAQDTARPWMNPKLSPEERAEMVLKQLTLDEKLALLHGNGMAHEKWWHRRHSPLREP